MSFENEVIASLQKVGVKQVQLETPPRPELGDLAFACFDLAKEKKTNPVELAKHLAEKLKPHGLISSIKSTGPYVNFFVNFDALAELTMKEASKTNFGA